MRIPWALGGIALLVGVAATHPDAVQNLYEQLYPSDAARREALDLCFLANRTFNRLDSDERESCYRQHLAAAAPVPAPPPPAPPPPSVPAPTLSANSNFVDLWRASGQGRMPRNDVRFEQQNERYIHPVDQR